MGEAIEGADGAAQCFEGACVTRSVVTSFLARLALNITAILHPGIGKPEIEANLDILYQNMMNQISKTVRSLHGSRSRIILKDRLWRKVAGGSKIGHILRCDSVGQSLKVVILM